MAYQRELDCLKDIIDLPTPGRLEFVHRTDGSWLIIRRIGGGFFGHSLYESVVTAREGKTFDEALDAEEKPYDN